MKEQNEDEFHFLIHVSGAVVSTEYLSVNTVFREKGRETYASCRIPAPARRRGDNPMLDMIAAVESSGPSLRASAEPMIRRLQNMNRYSQPRRPGSLWRMRIYKTGMERMA